MSDHELLEGYYASLRDDFCAFFGRCFWELHLGKKLEMSEYIEVITSRLADVREGRSRRLIINVPPRHLKSQIGSIAFPAWCLGHNPSAQIMCVSYAQPLSDDLARRCRAIIMSDWYQRLFPATRLNSPRPALEELITTAGGCRLANSVGGSVTGRGADIIIIDDPLKPDEAISDNLRQAANDWFDGTLTSRLNDQRHGAIVLIMQRLHEDDLTGHVLEQEAWNHLCLPAIAQEDEEHQYMTPLEPKTFRRQKGQLLHPERLPQQELEKQRRRMGSQFFTAQYLQRPTPAGGGIVKPEWFQRYTIENRPDHFDRIVQSWDTANKVTELSDYSVCTTWGTKGNRSYLLHVLRKRLDFPDLKKLVRSHQQDFWAKDVLIEDKASGTQLIQELNRDGLGPVTRYRPESDKIMRMHAQTAAIEDGRACCRPKHPGSMTICTRWPFSRKANTMTRSTLPLSSSTGSTPMRAEGAYEYARRQAEKLSHPEGSYVRMKPPAGVSHVQTFSGRNLRVEDDRTVAVSEEDARYLIGAGWQRVSSLPAPWMPGPPIKGEYARGSMEWLEQQRRARA